eukprot:TRINITY_DN78156_c0_g1_i1.p1 TRINITY_DN78156_c0_g1~~TRINITY_DN78156_c0_g1_i1.p1  ORF type:complete len:507 (-),score=64.16 TRINITY_DN78156_c0_g1_i1:743-2263(-)
MKIATFVVLSAFCIGIWFIPVSASCTCNDFVDDPYPTPLNSSNVIAKLTSVLLRLLPGSPGVPQRLAVVTAAIFDTYALSTKPSLPSVSGVCPAIVHTTAESATVDDTAAYAAYAAMRLVFRNEPEKLISLDGYMTSLGYDSRLVDGHVGGVIARAVAMKFKLPMPPTPYQPPNPPSNSFDAMCDTITDPDGWQAQCVQSMVGMKCQPQNIPFGALFNASLITSNSPVSQLVSKIPRPPTFDDDLSTLPFATGLNDFADEYLHTLAASSSLDDYHKIVAEFFAPNIALRLFNRALDEVNQRNVSAPQTATLFFAMGAAMRDALVASVTVKLTYSTIRPISVIQCAYSDQNITAWNAPYRGVRPLGKEDGQWRSYLQTPPFPGYTSGHSAVAAAGARVLGHFFEGERPLGANCHMTKAGMSVIEPRIEKGSPGYEAGLTDVPNRGPRSEGFSPADDVTICWNSWEHFAKLVAKSRLLGGIHIPADNDVGNTLGAMIGDQAYAYVTGS